MKNIEKFIKNLTNDVIREIFYDKSKNTSIKKLHVYDFDDTLVSTDSMIYAVNSVTGKRNAFHPHDFHEYHLGINEHFDLSNFENVINPIILPHFEKFKSDYNTYGPTGVAILTARPDAEGVENFLYNQNIFDVEVAAIGAFDPMNDVRLVNAERKRVWLENKLQNNPSITFLAFYDDNKENIKAANKLKNLFPNVMFHIEKVQYGKNRNK